MRECHENHGGRGRNWALIAKFPSLAHPFSSSVSSAVADWRIRSLSQRRSSVKLRIHWPKPPWLEAGSERDPPLRPSSRTLRPDLNKKKKGCEDVRNPLPKSREHLDLEKCPDQRSDPVVELGRWPDQLGKKEKKVGGVER